MYIMTRKFKVLPKVIREARRAAVLVNLNDDISIRWLPLLYGSRRPLCTSKVEDKHILYTGKDFAQTRKEQCWCYDPTIKYQALRRCSVPRYAYYDDSATDWSDASASASDSEIETETMEAEEAQTQKDKIPTTAIEEQIYRYDPNINYEIVKQFAYLDSPDPPDSFTSYPPDSETDAEEAQTKLDIFRSEATEDQIFLDPNFKYGWSVSSVTGTETETEVEQKTMAEEETYTHDDKILAGTKDEQLFYYDPSIKYEPLKRYVVPRFAFGDSSSTDWSDSSDSSAFLDSEPETETKIMAAEEADPQKDKILSGTKEEQLFCHDLVNSASTDLQSVAEGNVNQLF